MNTEQELTIILSKVNLLIDGFVELRNENEVLKEEVMRLKAQTDLDKNTNFVSDDQEGGEATPAELTREERVKLRNELDVAIAELAQCIDWLKKYL